MVSPKNNQTKKFTPILEEVAKCPLCNSSESEFIFWNIDRYFSLPGKFGLVKCSKCSFHRLSPRPVEEILGDYYPAENYYSYQIPDELEFFQKNQNAESPRNLKQKLREAVLDSYGYPVPKLSAWQKMLQPILKAAFKKRALYGLEKIFPNYVEGGRILDIGCGNAETLAYLKFFGWQVQGIDFNPAAAETAKKLFDIDVFVGKVEDSPFEPESFDLIIMSHVIEHLPQVVDSMKHITGLLKPNGTIYVETPNIDAFSFKQSQEYWYPLECPRHLFLFNPKNLEEILKQSGIKTTKVETFFYDTYRWEETYRIEEKEGKLLEKRPQDNPNFRRKKLNFLAKAQHIFNPLNGDIIRIWGNKE